MPEFCKLYANVKCPDCGASVDDQLDFQWGRVPCQYRLGDAIRWQCAPTGVPVDPWKYVRTANGLAWNCGDPTIADVIVLDVNLYNVEYYTRGCRACGVLFDGAAIFIRDGRIAEARLLRKGELEAMIGSYAVRPDIILVSSDGHLQPRPDWVDHPLRADDLHGI